MIMKIITTLIDDINNNMRYHHVINNDYRHLGGCTWAATRSRATAASAGYRISSGQQIVQRVPT